MPARGGHLEGATGLRLPAHLGEVDASTPLRAAIAAISTSGGSHVPSEEPSDVGERRRRDDPERTDLRRLARVRGRNHDAVQAGARRGDRHRKDAGRRQQLALEGQLAGEGVPHDGRSGHLCGRGKDADGDRQIESRSVLAEAGGREVHDHAAERPFETGTLDGRSHTVARIVHRGAGEAGEDQRRESSPDVRLDRDEMSTDAEDGDPHHPSIHPVRTIRRRSDITRAYHHATERPGCGRSIRGREG